MSKTKPAIIEQEEEFLASLPIVANQPISEKEENIFIEKMNLDNPDLGWLPEFVGGVVDAVFHPKDTISVFFGEENVVIPFPA
jgi:hypothetical protein